MDTLQIVEQTIDICLQQRTPSAQSLELVDIGMTNVSLLDLAVQCHHPTKLVLVLIFSTGIQS